MRWPRKDRAPEMFACISASFLALVSVARSINPRCLIYLSWSPTFLLLFAFAYQILDFHLQSVFQTIRSHCALVIRSIGKPIRDEHRIDRRNSLGTIRSATAQKWRPFGVYSLSSSGQRYYGTSTKQLKRCGDTTSLRKGNCQEKSWP